MNPPAPGPVSGLSRDPGDERRRDARVDRVAPVLRALSARRAVSGWPAATAPLMAESLLGEARDAAGRADAVSGTV